MFWIIQSFLLYLYDIKQNAWVMKSGIHSGLKIRCPQGHTGSSPVPGTNIIEVLSTNG